MDFYTIDFETANSLMTSACSIGIVGVKNNKKIFSKHYYINPKQPFDPFNITIHHIDEAMVEDALTFLELWDTIKEYFTNTVVFAHNSMFDFNVLNSLLEYYNIDKPTFKFGCTVKLARKLWTDELTNYRLNTVASYLESNLNHHDALSDAQACADIVIRGLQKCQEDTVENLYNTLDLKFGFMNKYNYYNTYSFKGKKNVKKSLQRPLIDKAVYISGKIDKKIKKSLLETIYVNGGFRTNEIDNRLSILVIMDDYLESDYKKAETLKSSNIQIEITKYEEFMRYLDEFNN
ncbi:MAG: 3'-5' exonuclease [Bacilli bacterium]